jgi:hypothetical protein
MATDPTPDSGSRRHAPIVPIIIFAVVAVVAIVWVMRGSSAHRAPALPPPTVAQTTAPAPLTATPNVPANAKPLAAEKPVANSKEPLAPLIPGSPLTDNRFAAISCDIVIAARGIKQDKEWETNMVLYMDKVLKKAGITTEQYNAYALALQKNPDRGRAVVDNIMMRVEKKIGIRMTTDQLPMFRFDKEAVNQLQQKLKH